MILPLRSVTDCIYCDTFYQTYPETCEAPSYLSLLRNVRLYRNSEGILTYVEGFLCKMTENMQADVALSRKAVFVRCCLKSIVGSDREYHLL